MLPDGLAIVAVLEREDPRDVFISRKAKTLRELPQGAVVGTRFAAAAGDGEAAARLTFPSSTSAAMSRPGCASSMPVRSMRPCWRSRA